MKMKETEKSIAKHLLQIKAIKLEPAKPFLWASGWLSPIYCDNRLILSYPDTRKLVTNSFCELIRRMYPAANLIAGVATGAIAHGALVAGQLELPFAYVRPSPKSHGLSNLIEGRVSAGDRVVIVEDLVSTGKSSLAAAETLRAADCEILGMLAIFTYDFDIARDNFRRDSCDLNTLTNYHTLINVAGEMGFIGKDQFETLQEWRKDPSKWGVE
jgi:orotate phosphoribosyltransferase